MKRIVVTGGHLSPALALIEQITKEKNIEIIFFGRKYATEGSASTSAEFKEIQFQNINFVNITAGRLSRKITLQALKSLAKIPLGFIQSFYYLLKFRPKLIVSFGGYLSLPAVFGGWLLGIKSITHEQASIPGLANKINSLFVEKIFVSFKETEKYFPDKKTQAIGNLTRQVIFNKEPKNPKIAAFIKSNSPYILVTGGNQGSHFINNEIFKSAKLLKDYKVFHILGTANHQNDHQRAKSIRNKNYFCCDFVTSEDIGPVFENAQFVICRSGANTIWELAVLGKPAIFIPLPHAASGEQEANAKILEEAGSAVVIKQEDVNSQKLIVLIQAFEQNLNTYQKNAQNFKKSLPTSSARVLKDKILKLI